MYESNIKYLRENEIDLKDSFFLLWKYKLFIFMVTLCISILVTCYLLLFPIKPIYKGSLTVLIGEVKSQDTISPIANIHNLKSILEIENNEDNKLENIIVNIPEKTNRILTISSSHYNKNTIKEKINKAYLSLLEIEKDKLKFYKKFTKTKKITDILIKDIPINKVDKKAIIGTTVFISLLLSFFLVFIIQFIGNLKKEE